MITVKMAGEEKICTFSVMLREIAPLTSRLVQVLGWKGFDTGLVRLCMMPQVRLPL